MYDSIITLFHRKKSEEIQILEKTIKMLAGYHAMSIDNDQFLRQYRHLIAMYLTLCRETDTIPIFATDDLKGKNNV